MRTAPLPDARTRHEVVPPRRALTEPNATLVRRELLTESIALLRVRPDNGPVAFDAGQYVSLGLPLADGLLQRPYSPANPPGADADLELLVRRVPDGQLTPLLWELPLGARLRIGSAKGLFRLIPDDRRHHLFVATGTGLAPMLSMIATLLARQAPPPITLVHGVRYPDELAYRERIAAWAERGRVRFTAAVSRPQGPSNNDDGVLEGRLPDLMPTLWPLLDTAPAGTVAYLCGNPAVVQRVGEFLRSAGVRQDAVRTEEYWPAPWAHRPVSGLGMQAGRPAC
jgi:ferredoxin-NADP reductase